MDTGCGVPDEFCGRFDRACDHLRLRWWPGMAYAMDGSGNDANGDEHGGERFPTRNRGNDNGVGDPEGHRKLRYSDPTLVLSIVAMGGLMLYVLIYKLDTTTALMLNGFFGVLIGRLSKGNGNQ